MTNESQELLNDARDQLSLVLGFFSRVDAKASVVLAINTGMLAVLASNAPPLHKMSALAGVAAVFTVLIIAASLWFLYRIAFPSLSGGHRSLIYFREIAQRTESTFIDEFTQQNHQARAKDVLGQVWRNSEILKQKFDALKVAFILMAIAIFPWVVAVAMFSAVSADTKSLLTR
jgi:Pycsar effector protein